MSSVVANTNNTQSCYLPQLLIINLGHRNLIPVLQPGNNRLDYLPFTLQGLILRKMKLYPANTNVHESLIILTLETVVQA